ncbi:MAG: U32 family peptidase [Clostridia bacterium]|nr:U32 family peptidase [Clostridia bacterium]
MSDSCMRKKPELLCPAGSPEALDAAIEGGADAVYFGGAQFNARMHAKNFGGDALHSAVLRAHAYGVKTYLTLNTLLFDRELPAFLHAAEEAAEAGIDALIVADLGGASAIHRTYPEIELHASTQMSAHCSEAGTLLRDLGFSRMVIARETSARDLEEIVKTSPIEIECFIHGALCVSHSGQCLFSSLVGGRSGNRGECAQPCRLPYSSASHPDGRPQYPLSLKDLSLAEHVPALIRSGVASLKIEGRMKSPEYVRDTARIWRRLLDEGRGATPQEMREMAESFSRGGFTDGYFTGRIGRNMLGVRSDADKRASREAEPFRGIVTRRIPLQVEAEIRRGAPMRMSLSDGQRRIAVLSSIPEEAQNAPLSRDTVTRNLTKFGNTPYAVSAFSLSLDEGLMVPLSLLNDLRRRAIAAFSQGDTPASPFVRRPYSKTASTNAGCRIKSARFASAEQITQEARAYFDRLYLPLHRHVRGIEGVVLPPVLFDRDTEAAESMLCKAKENGARYALVGNLGHLSLVRKVGLIPVGDFRLNATNRESVLSLESLGFTEILLSPELTLPQARDISGATSVAVYGRIPLMTLEKCVGRELGSCAECESRSLSLRDRRGAEFPVLQEWEHRSVICNSLPTSMSDKQDALRSAGLAGWHFLFTVEGADEVNEVIDAFQHKKALPYPVRRMM